MEMERLNENTIRVIIGSDDLDKRGITVLDLLGNHQQIESFFYSILEEVDTDHQFQNNDAVTFQVLPNREGLELYISKNVDLDDEMDSGKFASLPEFDEDGVSEYLKKQKADIEDKERRKYVPNLKTEIFEFDSLNTFIDLAKILYLENGVSDLYLYKDKYYLKIELYGEGSSDTMIFDQIAIAREYGNKTKVTDDILSEYGDLLMGTSALELSRHYFKN